MNARMEKEMMTIGFFFAACWNGNVSHSSHHVQVDHKRDGLFLPLLIGVLEEVEVLGLDLVIRAVCYDPVLFLLALRFLE